MLEGLGGQAAEAGMPGQGRGNLPTSPSFAVVLLPSCSTPGFGASLVCPGIPIRGEAYFNMDLLRAELGRSLTKILQKAGVVLAEQKTTEFQSSRAGAWAVREASQALVTPVVHSPAKPAGPSPAWLQLPALRLGWAGAAGQGSLLLLVPSACTEPARRAAWKQCVIEEVFSQLNT